MSVATSERPWTQDETAEYLSCSTRHLSNLRKRGELRAIKIGTRVLFDPNDVRAFLENSKEA